jgi:hypothetical protein
MTMTYCEIALPTELPVDHSAETPKGVDGPPARTMTMGWRVKIAEIVR